MKQSLVALALALGCSVALVNAQDTKTTTKVDVDGAKARMVTYTGCVHTGTESKSFILDKIVPVSRTTTTDTVGTAGATTTTSTTYMLVPGEKVELQTHVGHKVEVSGMMVPAGDSKTTTTTKVERENAPDSKTKETVKTDNALPQFRVMSIKSTGESCD
jgi:hypothetical protein